MADAYTETITTKSLIDDIKEKAWLLLDEINTKGVYVCGGRDDKFSRWNPKKHNGCIAIIEEGLLLIADFDSFARSIIFLPWEDYAIKWSFQKEKIWHFKRR